jgi:hypothetical protein
VSDIDGLVCIFKKTQAMKCKVLTVSIKSLEVRKDRKGKDTFELSD